MKLFPRAALAASCLALALAPCPLSAQAAPAAATAPTDGRAPSYLDPARIDVAFLGNPPADGSPQTRAEIEELLRLQAARTPEQAARAATEVSLKPEAFAGVLGAWFAEENVPAAFALLHAAKGDAKLVSRQAKKLWLRPRPPVQDPRIHPCVALEKTASYPSGHSMLGTLWAAILSQLVPDRAAELAARGREIGDDRLLAGVHFPSDVEAGRRLGAEIARRLLESPAFRTDLEKAKAEVAAARARAGTGPGSKIDKPPAAR